MDRVAKLINVTNAPRPPGHADHGRQPGVARRRARGRPRGAARRADAAGGRPRRGPRGPPRPGEPRRPARRATSWTCSSGWTAGERWASAWTTSTCSGSATTWPRGRGRSRRYTLLVQLKDHGAGDPPCRGGPVSTALGEGVADLDGLIAILAAAGFDGPVCVELASLGPDDVDELAMVDRSVAWLRAHLPGARG